MAPHGLLSVVLAFALTSMSTIVVALRFYTRYFIVGKLTIPDWMMLLALIGTWASTVANWYMVQFMDHSSLNPNVPETIERVVVGALLSIWLYRLNYIIDLCLVKTSILLFYNEIAASNKRFHFGVRALLFINVAGGIAMAFASIFMCYPVADAWSFEVFMGGVKGKTARHCYSPGPFWLSNAGYNLVTDVIIWTVPMAFLMNLQAIPLRRRLELVATFSVGIVAIIASVVRLYTIVLWLSSYEQQRINTANVLIWSQVEQHAGLIAGSIPFLRPLYRQVLARARRREQNSPSPAAHLVEEPAPELIQGMLRRPILPSTTSTCGSSNREFRRPEWVLEPIEPVGKDCIWEVPHPT
ncbi:hypothetical protein COCC4DRAFT_40385 [Bipolaris maydis ATCC 48331]|uniref:Rhodopsin domain-containing protein n=1 Tax=Cochliobolus heterostrophus (strain C4 / ATCC 48331 / race T) TaxID=665024 RepID=N4WZY8_COCH4|nr:uncharacterized protein COCC4DRAFT_40385 [Bipolaris maydis ATCC 48331]KAJ5024937.1 hypothetical protein J3E73DRAFT_397674 [Bipolaris maydis]ENI04995.1 hypothetical protein COCC4DRAFT_40385 [Bipolaris maydis ATCC 48331]KAJ5057157.1 hypothetical protein J3E74DRAFT_439343 [Bipolaris maydis]KAJ6212646.1 hypothetical protein PSV09DRAFT_2417024 [Bipolaris maydis]KAJ6266066.1 hypothetical protein PSV08DRAFT_381720 [Bipolaris maydis]